MVLSLGLSAEHVKYSTVFPRTGAHRNLVWHVLPPYGFAFPYPKRDVVVSNLQVLVHRISHKVVVLEQWVPVLVDV